MAKGTELRLVLTTLRHGTVVREHRAEVPATLHVLTGRTPVRVGDREPQLDPGASSPSSPDWFTARRRSQTAPSS